MKVVRSYSFELAKFRREGCSNTSVESTLQVTYLLTDLYCSIAEPIPIFPPLNIKCPK